MFRKSIAVLAILGVTLNAGFCLCAGEEGPALSTGSAEAGRSGAGHRHAHPGADPSTGHPHPAGHRHSGPAHSDDGAGENCGCSESSEAIVAAPFDGYAVVSKPIAVWPVPFPSAALLPLTFLAAGSPGYPSVGPPRPSSLALHLAIHLLSL